MQQRVNPWLPVLLGLSMGGFIGLHYFLGRWTNFPELPHDKLIVSAFFLLFFLYFIQLRLIRSEKEIRWATYAAIAFRAALIFCLPNLSDDFYRFVWDGHLQGYGGLLEQLPSEMMAGKDKPFGQDPAFWQGVYENLNSQNYYTVYPPALQFVFRIAALIGGESLLGMAIVMKSFIFLAELGTIFLLRRLLQHWKLPHKWALVYVLNPLVISEMVGNLHFEAFMLFFTLLGIWLLVKGRIWIAALPFALAICSKILPLLFFPYLIRRLGWLKAIGLGLLTGALTLGLFALFFDLNLMGNYVDSVRLYFSKFEFNANIYYIGRWALGDKGYWVNRFLPLFPPLFILLGALLWRSKAWKTLPGQLLFVLAVYQILQPVIHPWYLAPLIGLAALTRYRFPVWWSFLIPMTYLTYWHPDFAQPMWALWIEYIILFAVIFFEWQFKAGEKTLEDWVREKPYLKGLLQRSIPARMAIKLERIAQYLPEGSRILDIGTGNGGLCLELRKKGYAVQPVDVKNISFFESVQPQIYDGERLPYEKGDYDVTMLITVLHHTPDPEKVFDEAVRVAGKRIIVMEDIYKNPFQKHLTFFTDSLVNLEFVGHPHTNKSDAEWQALFADRGLQLVAREEFRTLIFFRQVIYVLEVPD